MQAAAAVAVGSSGLRLKVLVYLGYVLHHALPVRPVSVQHLAELLQERERVTEGPGPRAGLVLPRKPPLTRCQVEATTTQCRM